MPELYMRLRRLVLLMIVPHLLQLFGCKPKSIYGNNPAVGKYYDINGIKLYVEQYGKGQPLLMLHGNGGDMSAFTENVPYFAKRYHVILVDSRAQGKSTDTSPTLTYEQMADDFATLLDTLKLPKAYVIGWSDGGINSIVMAMRHPDKVIKFASTGANLWPDSTAIEPADWKREFEYYNRHRNRIWTTDAAKNQWKIFMLDWAEPNIKLTDIQKINVPAMIIAGDHDVINDAHTRLIQKNIPNSKLWIVKNSGHGTLIEHAAEFNKQVDAFFQEK
ncbi:alpha/beta fold hydrolase [Mucilaginibacter glaciei]|uniref:Alpha/beta hydrolase n=1 Tax=Mucilaginibacter glaciei TaxID=2772109 RepID=A0A926S1W9_9SPHI|nr:alpha/beta hydrolase [Mucilaginibacter glaciei]MBD1394510.1 alpha/beta hydrolase [Mucilaginibacter glaciei]